MAENEFLDMKKLKFIGDDNLEARPCFVEVLPGAACSLVTQEKKFANRLKVGKVLLIRQPGLLGAITPGDARLEQGVQYVYWHL